MRDRIRHQAAMAGLAAAVFWGTAAGQIPPTPAPAQRPPVAAPGALPGEPLAESVIQIFKLKYAKVDPSMQKALEIFAGGGKIAYDARSSSLIVQAPKDRIPQIREYLAETDQPVPSRETLQIRLVWLVAGLPAAGKAPPKDLDNVLRELARFEFGELQMVAQTLIQTTPDGTFRLSANPMLESGVPCQVRLEGQLQTPAPDSSQVQVQLSAASIRQPQPPRLPNLPGAPQPPAPLEPQIQTDITTTISVPLDHPVVLCATPTEKATSVFVIQVMSSPRR